TNFNSGTVTVIDTHLRLQTGMVSVPTAWGVAISPDGSTLAVTSYIGNTLSLFDTRTLHLTHTVAVGLHPEGVIFNAAGDRVYVANNASGTGGTDGSMSVITPTNGAVIATITMQTPAELGRSPTTG